MLRRPEGRVALTQKQIHKTIVTRESHIQLAILIEVRHTVDAPQRERQREFMSLESSVPLA